MIFSNCTVKLPTTPGLHIVSSGCGSGKTTMISKIVADYWQEGILIVIPTIEASDDLEKRIDRELTEKDKFCCKSQYLNCQNIAEMESYKKNPEKLTEIDVLVITSVRLIIDPYALFLAYKSGKRKYVLIDEMINFYPPGFELPKAAYDIFSFIDKAAEHNGKKGIKIDGPFYKHSYQDGDLMMAAYTSSKQNFFSSSNALNDFKVKAIVDHILNNGFTPMKNKLTDFADQTSVMLLDGTADCIFKSSDQRLLPITGDRYLSNIHFQVFDKRLKRKNNENWKKDLIEKYEQDFIKIVKEAASHGKVLIVTWKTIDIYPKNKGEADTFESGSDKKSYNFPKILTDCLIDSGIDKNLFSIIYRGSGQDRGSNEYRDYASVVFCGEWRLPDNIVGDINSMFGCKCSFRDYMKSLIIQTICRTRIRKHLGEDIWVYFSSDIDYNLMYEAQEYFSVNSSKSCIIEGILKPCPKRKKCDKRRLFELICLYDYDKNIRNAIETGKSYSFTITLDDLWNYVKKDKKAKSRYKTTIDFLNDNYGIQMIIK